MHSTRWNRLLPTVMLALSITVLTISFLHAQQDMPKQSTAGSLSKSATIHQEVDFAASPAQVYEALLDPKRFSAFSGRPAEIDREVGGAFSLFDKHIVGQNVELIQSKRIVQAWRVVDWPEGVYSIVRFEFKAKGLGTHLVFDHTGFPEDARDHLAAGWESNYWTPLKKYFSKQ